MIHHWERLPNYNVLLLNPLVIFCDIALLVYKGMWLVNGRNKKDKQSENGVPSSRLLHLWKQNMAMRQIHTNPNNTPLHAHYHGQYFLEDHLWLCQRVNFLNDNCFKELDMLVDHSKKIWENCNATDKTLITLIYIIMLPSGITMNLSPWTWERTHSTLSYAVGYI